MVYLGRKEPKIVLAALKMIISNFFLTIYFQFQVFFSPSSLFSFLARKSPGRWRVTPHPKDGLSTPTFAPVKPWESDWSEGLSKCKMKTFIFVYF